jgi:hypothetical protein
MMSETLRILDECKQPTVQEVKRLIMMEMGYINCGHPDFLGKNGITEWVISQRSRLEDDRQQLRSPNSGRRSPMSAVMSNMLRATNRELAAGRKEGYLTKLGGMHKTWKKRYFILRDTTVIFYEKQGDKNVKGQFQLDHCLVRDVDRNAIYPQSEADAVLAAAGEENGQVFKGKPFAFEIFTHDQSMLFRNHRRLYLVAESERDKEEWIAALAHGIEFSRQLTLVLQSDSSPEDSPHKQPQQQPHQENSKDAANRRAPPPPPRSKKPPVPPALNTSRSNLQPTSALPAIPIRLYATDLIGTNHDGALAPELANTGSFTPSVHNSKNGKQQSQKQQPQQLSSTDDTTIALVRALLHSYFVIVRKHIQDLVPKAIMLLMVTKIKKDLPVLLTNKVLCGGDKRFNVCDLMQESEQVREERRLKMDMCRLVREALHVIEHEVRKEMV